MDIDQTAVDSDQLLDCGDKKYYLECTIYFHIK